MARGGGLRVGSSVERDYSAGERNLNMLGTILLILLVLMLIGAVPTGPHRRDWGYLPSGGVTLILLVVLVMMLLGRI